MQQSGGLLLAAGLDGGNTLVAVLSRTATQTSPISRPPVAIFSSPCYHTGKGGIPMKESKTTILGILLLPALGLVNLSHLLWTIWLTVEQIETGWGYGTGISTLGIVPLMTQMFSAPALLAAILFFILACFHHHRKGVLIANICLFLSALLQFGIFHFFAYH
jgi:hypothetical protein